MTLKEARVGKRVVYVRNNEAIYKGVITGIIEAEQMIVAICDSKKGKVKIGFTRENLNFLLYNNLMETE